MAEKRFYWIKLKDTFMTSDAVDFLMGQKNGAEYVVLYQMLCLRTINTNGVLARQIGEIIIPYDAQKIQRDCKYFSLDTVIVALELYKKLGLVYEQKDGHLKITDFENLIGSELGSAQRMRKLRASQCDDRCDKIVTIEKDIEKDSQLKIKKIKDKFRRAGAYTRVFDSLIDEVAEVLGRACCMNRELTFDGRTYTAEDFQQIVEKFDRTDLCRVVNSLLAHKDEIENREFYILGVVVRHNAEDWKEGASNVPNKSF